MIFAENLKNIFEALNSSKILVMTLSFEKNITSISSYAEKLFGLKSEKIVGRDFSEFCQDFFLENLSLLPNKNDALVIDDSFYINNKTHHVSWSISHSFDENKKPNGFIIFGKDITNEKDKAVEQETYLRNIVSCMPGSIYWKDLNGVYLGCNDTVATMAGVSSTQEIIGKNDFDFVWKDVADSVLSTERAIMESGVAQTLEISGKLADNTFRTFLTTKTPLRDGNNNIVGIVATSLDITERKKMEEELRIALEQAEIANEAKISLKGISPDAQATLDSMNENSTQYFCDLVNEKKELNLTTREFQCMSLWIAGNSAKKIGQILGISSRTVEVHMDRIRVKNNIISKDDVINRLYAMDLYLNIILYAEYLRKKFQDSRR